MQSFTRCAAAALPISSAQLRRVRAAKVADALGAGTGRVTRSARVVAWLPIVVAFETGSVRSEPPQAPRGSNSANSAIFGRNIKQPLLDGTGKLPGRTRP